MAREKQGYRDALERIRHEAAGELVTVPEAAHIVYGTDPYAARKVCRNFEGWIGAGRDKRIPATALAPDQHRRLRVRLKFSRRRWLAPE